MLCRIVTCLALGAFSIAQGGNNIVISIQLDGPAMQFRGWPWIFPHIQPPWNISGNGYNTKLIFNALILAWRNNPPILQSFQFSQEKGRQILSSHPSYSSLSLSALVNTKFDSPIPTTWNVASVFEIFEQKRFASCCGQLWQSVPKTEPPLALTALLYAEQDLSPLGIIIMRLGRGTQISDFSKLHWLDWLCRKRKGKCQDFICSWHSSPWTTCHLHFTVHSSVTSSQTQNVAE